MTDKNAVTLHVDVIAGRALASKDRNGFSDPFCKIHLEDEQGRRDIDTKKKTTIKKKTLNPQWNESFTFVLLSKHKNLVIQCWDKDRIGRDFMGEIVIPLADIRPSTQGWISLQQKRDAKKIEKITGDLNLRVSVVVENSAADLGDKQKIARVINKLYDHSYSGLDVYCHMPCCLAQRPPKEGTLVGTTKALCFFTERKRGKRKAVEISWWEIVDISRSSNSIIVSTASEATHQFERIRESGENTVDRLVEAWNKQSSQMKPSEKRKSRLHIGSWGKKKGLLKIKDSDSKSENDYEELADITEYTEATDLSDGSADNSNEESVSFLHDSLEEAKPIAKGTLPEKESTLTPLPVNPDGTITPVVKNAAQVHCLVKHATSRHNPDLSSIFIKLVECQYLPEQNGEAPNIFVETRVGHQLYISTLERDKHPVFSEEYLFEANTKQHKSILFSVFHKSKDQTDVFIGEASLKFAEIAEKELVTIRKDLVLKSTFTRLVNASDSSKKVPSIGRVQAKVSYDASKKIVTLAVVKYQSLVNPEEPLFVTASCGASSYFTQLKAGEYIEFNETFEFKSVSKTASLILSVCNSKSDKPMGILAVSVMHLQRELPNVWLEIPIADIKETKRVISLDKPSLPQDEQKKEPVTEEKRSTSSSKVEVKKEPTKKTTSSSTVTPETSDTGKTVVTVPPKGKGIDKTYIIAGFGTLFFLLALLYTWFA